MARQQEIDDQMKQMESVLNDLVERETKAQSMDEILQSQIDVPSFSFRHKIPKQESSERLKMLIQDRLDYEATERHKREMKRKAKSAFVHLQMYSTYRGLL